MSFVVYKHTFPNRKVYIGITSQTVSRRWRKGEGYSHNRMMYAAIMKYGWDNITHEILYDDLSQEEAEQIEIELIEKYQSTNSKYGYNICAGGGVNFLPKESIASMAEKHRGMHHTEETKAKLSKMLKGRIISEETREKHRGSNNYSYGRFGAKSAVAKTVLQLNDDGSVVAVWESIADACRALNIKNQSINNVLNGRNKHAGGYVWQYKL